MRGTRRRLQCSDGSKPKCENGNRPTPGDARGVCGLGSKNGLICSDGLPPTPNANNKQPPNNNGGVPPPSGSGVGSTAGPPTGCAPGTGANGQVCPPNVDKDWKCPAGCGYVYAATTSSAPSQGTAATTGSQLTDTAGKGPPPPPTTDNTGTIIAVAAVGGVVIIAIVLIAMYFMRKKKVVVAQVVVAPETSGEVRPSDAGKGVPEKVSSYSHKPREGEGLAEWLVIQRPSFKACVPLLEELGVKHAIDLNALTKRQINQVCSDCMKSPASLSEIDANVLKRCLTELVVRTGTFAGGSGMLREPWKYGEGKEYACFLSHYKMEAASDARYLKDMLTRALDANIFLDSDGRSFESCAPEETWYLVRDPLRIGSIDKHRG